MTVLFSTILTLCVLGILAAVILYFVAQKFKVEEDPRIDEVEKMLPGANCGGCGFAGCRGLSEALVKRDDISALFCPVGGGDTMKAVAAYLGKAAAEKEPQTATIRCGGTCEKRPRTNKFDGAKSCAVAASLYVGETGCAFGCLLMLLDGDPFKALLFIVLSLVVQQFENNVIYPRVVGTSIGLSGMWVLVAVTVGGELMGVAGMLIMIPLASVFYTLAREFTDARLMQRQIPEDKLMNQPPEIVSQFQQNREKKENRAAVALQRTLEKMKQQNKKKKE